MVDDGRQDGMTEKGAGLWWQSRPFLLLCMLASAIPLLWPAVPPLGDMGDHMASYRILAEAGQAPLARYYAVHWAAVGNLGVEGIVLALHHVFGMGVELAARLVVMAIPPLTVAGLIALAREAHGRMPASAILAFPLAYGPAFQMGFVNFCLAQGFVFLAMALWLRLARTRGAAWRIILFTLLAPLLWLVHALGWALLVAYVFGMEAGRLVEQGRRWPKAVLRAGVTVTPMALPALWMIRSGGDQVAGETGRWFLSYKLRWIMTLFQERWMAWDLAAVMGLLFFAYVVIRSRRLSVRPVLGVPAAIGFIVFLALPYLFRGGAYLDMRMLPPAVMLALLSVYGRPAWSERGLAVAATVFFVARLAGTTIAFAQLAQGHDREWRAIAALPPGGTVLVLANVDAESRWGAPRLTHIGGLAVVRAGVFTNGQWTVPGQHLIQPRLAGAGRFDRDPSSLIFPPGGEGGLTDFEDAIRDFDRCTFDAVWTIGFPKERTRSPDLTPVWAQGNSAVYRVRRGRCLSDAPSVR
jgi:hypothetical protein